MAGVSAAFKNILHTQSPEPLRNENASRSFGISHLKTWWMSPGPLPRLFVLAIEICVIFVRGFVGGFLFGKNMKPWRPNKKQFLRWFCLETKLPKWPSQADSSERFCWCLGGSSKSCLAARLVFWACQLPLVPGVGLHNGVLYGFVCFCSFWMVLVFWCVYIYIYYINILYARVFFVAVCGTLVLRSFWVVIL